MQRTKNIKERRINFSVRIPVSLWKKYKWYLIDNEVRSNVVIEALIKELLIKQQEVKK